MNKIKRLLKALKMILKNSISDKEKIERIKDLINMIDEILDEEVING